MPAHPPAPLERRGSAAVSFTRGISNLRTIKTFAGNAARQRSWSTPVRLCGSSDLGLVGRRSRISSSAPPGPACNGWEPAPVAPSDNERLSRERWLANTMHYRNVIDFSARLGFSSPSKHTPHTSSPQGRVLFCSRPDWNTEGGNNCVQLVTKTAGE